MITAMNAYEVNIFDTRPDPTYRTGAIVNVSKSYGEGLHARSVLRACQSRKTCGAADAACSPSVRNWPDALKRLVRVN